MNRDRAARETQAKTVEKKRFKLKRNYWSLAEKVEDLRHVDSSYLRVFITCAMFVESKRKSNPKEGRGDGFL